MILTETDQHFLHRPALNIVERDCSSRQQSVRAAAQHEHVQSVLSPQSPWAHPGLQPPLLPLLSLPPPLLSTLAVALP